MYKEFCPYEIALALKELGFDAQCFSHYRDKESLIACNQGIYGISYSDIEAPTKVILAPLYQQAFRWLYQKLDIENGTMPLYTESQQLLLKELIEIVKNK